MPISLYTIIRIFLLIMPRPDHMAIGKEMKRLPRKEASTSMAPMETEAITGVDLGLVMDGVAMSQDFALWFGKSIFESILAEVIQKKYLEHTAVTLVDVLELMVAGHCPDAKRDCKERKYPQKAYEGFYRSIHGRRCDMSDNDWEAFRQQLSFNIATICGRLRNEKVPELHEISLSTPSETSTAPAPTSDARSRSSSSSSSTSSLVYVHQQYSAESPTTIEETAQNQPMLQSQATQQVLQPLANVAPAPQTAVEMHRYTSVLNEHAAFQGEKLTYEKRQLSLSPSSWRCTATFGGISGEGTGRNTTQAKHAASKKICELIDLLVL
ncbi:unnamed protein product [Periconia digitata]|uniref:DRBM domain-containing protein n=1 Tax=Periconia digitata TaxID=1303443 RepID=A0A9W4XRL7_9PLEO|nr:unnamed protein product [Periconia digitata]